MIFISHSRQNGGAALKLCDRLNEHGLKVWLDTREIEAGTDWSTQVAQAIGSASAFVILIGPSSSSDQSQRFEWQQMTELEIYLDPSKPLIPVVIGQAEVPGFVRARKSISVEPEAIDYGMLTDAIAAVLGKPGDTIDSEKLERGKAARKKAIDSLKEYSVDLELDEVKRAALRDLK